MTFCDYDVYNRCIRCEQNFPKEDTDGIKCPNPDCGNKLRTRSHDSMKRNVKKMAVARY